MLVCFFHFARETAGAGCAPGVPCALDFRGEGFLAQLGRAPRRGKAESYPAVIASVSEAIHSFFVRCCGLLRFARNDGCELAV